MQKAVEIDPGDAVEFANRQIRKVSGRKESRCVHKNVGGYALGTEFPKRSFDGARIGDVNGDGEGMMPRL